MSSANGQRADNRALSDREQELLKRLLSDPFSFPLEFKQWLVNFIESSEMILPRQSIHGLKDGRTPPTEWEDVGTSGGPGGGGIQFDTYPQSGDWLHIDTTGNREGVPNGSGVKITAQDTIDLNTQNSISLYDTGGGGIYLTSNAGPKGGSFIGIQADGETFIEGDVIVLRSSGHDIQIQSGGNIWCRFGYDHSVSINLGVGESFQLGGSSGTLLRVDENGTYHIKAGATWVADL